MNPGNYFLMLDFELKLDEDVRDVKANDFFGIFFGMLLLLTVTRDFLGALVPPLLVVTVFEVFGLLSSFPSPVIFVDILDIEIWKCKINKKG